MRKWSRRSAGLRDVDRPLSYTDRLVVRIGQRSPLLPAADVERAEAKGNYVQLHARGRQYVLRETLSALEARPDPRRFIRIRRSRIVSVDRIREIVTDDMRWPGAIEGLAVRGLSNVELTQREELRGDWRKSFTTKDLGE